MRLKVNIATFFLLALAQLLHAQTESVKENNRFSLKITPLPLLDIYGGNSYRLGTEFKLKNNIALSLEYGKYFSYSAKGFFAPMLLNTKGNVIRAEVKLYRNQDKLCLGDYFSLEYQYKQITFDYEDSISIAPNPTYQKRYTIYKEISCLTFKFGHLAVYKKHFVVEGYAGVGLRFYLGGHNTLSDEERSGLLTGEGHGSLTGDAQRVNAFMILPNINVGIKLGYLFK